MPVYAGRTSTPAVPLSRFLDLLAAAAVVEREAGGPGALPVDRHEGAVDQEQVRVPEVAVLEDAERGAGEHEATVDAGRLAPGTYFLRVSVDGQHAATLPLTRLP